MNPEFDEVLLTAYLDDEVTDAERAHVEEQLRVSESSRKLLDDLKSVRLLIAQLHLLQSSRNFQQGPWNTVRNELSERRETSGDESSTILRPNDDSPECSRTAAIIDSTSFAQRPKPLWYGSFQRLGSLAALIAVVTCSSVLLRKSNPLSISRSDSIVSPSNMEKGETPASNSSVEASATPESDFVAPPAGPVELKRDVPKKSEENGPMFSKETELKLGRPQSRGVLGDAKRSDDSFRFLQSDPSMRLFVESVFQNPNREWTATSEPNASSLSADTAGNGKSDSSFQVLAFRFQKNVEQRQGVDVLQLDRLPAESENRSASPNTKINIEKSSDAKAKKASPQPLPLLIEFQIPSEDWVAGAERLRKLGVEVPLELPNGEYIDFAPITIEPKSESAESAPSDAPMIGFVPSKNGRDVGQDGQFGMQLGRTIKIRVRSIK